MSQHDNSTAIPSSPQTSRRAILTAAPAAAALDALALVVAVIDATTLVRRHLLAHPVLFHATSFLDARNVHAHRPGADFLTGHLVVTDDLASTGLGHMLDAVAVKPHLTCRRPEEAGDDLQQRRLPASRGSEQGDQLSRRNGQ